MTQKRARSDSASSSASPSKVARITTTSSHDTPRFRPNKVATAGNAAAVDRDPPLQRLLQADTVKSPDKGLSVVYWMRMQDIRVADNRALAEASTNAKKSGIPLIVMFFLSPQDYIAHDRGARKIDFILRNLIQVQSSLRTLDIPLIVTSVSVRRNLPDHVLSLASKWGATSIYANIEYEVDELRRDIQVCTLAKPKGIQVNFLHDKCVIPPGTIKTKDGKTHAVYSPYQRLWINKLNEDLKKFLYDYGLPERNPSSSHDRLRELFDIAVPSSLEGFNLSPTDQENMTKMWPAGEAAAQDILDRFFHAQSQSSYMGCIDPRGEDARRSDKQSRMSVYHKERDIMSKNTTSRLSPYLSAGVISARSLLRATMNHQQVSKVDASRDSGVGRWVQEIAWRDFYVNILSAFPRVSMGRPYLEKFSDVCWEEYQQPGSFGEPPSDALTSGYRGIRNGGDDNATLKAWKEGRTGYPIVDASMRCINECGWVHNRGRMITAMFLTKDLMIDWRVGERYFMETLVDGDLASNNGGWQWSASTGVDPCPYFRIFNPTTQSSKADPDGNFIRHFVPELAKVRGPEIHNPPPALRKRVGYPMPIVKHDEARQRALRRFKNIGEE